MGKAVADSTELPEPTNQPAADATRRRWNIPPDLIAQARARVRTAVSTSDDYKTRREGCEVLRELDAVMQPTPEPAADDREILTVNVSVNVGVTATDPPSDHPANGTDSPWPIPVGVVDEALTQLRADATSHSSPRVRREASKAVRAHEAATGASLPTGKDPQQ